MNKQEFSKKIISAFDEFFDAISDDDGEWIVKGFIDIYKNIYTISVDTKVVSKIIELMLFPVISRFAQANNLAIVLSDHQNHYPDVTFIDGNGSKYAVDLKSTYRTNANRINGFTLGAFTGYFRDRESHKNVKFPYGEYDGHFVLGVIYTRSDDAIDERRIYSIDDLEDIVSVVKSFEFIFHEKWRIASDRPGSGNTKNIGSVTVIKDMRSGSGPFSRLGEKVFDDYWMNYLTNDMARAIDSAVPYRNLLQYKQWKDR